LDYYFVNKCGYGCFIMLNKKHFYYLLPKDRMSLNLVPGILIVEAAKAPLLKKQRVINDQAHQLPFELEKPKITKEKLFFLSSVFFCCVSLCCINLCFSRICRF
jgi:hypothetical protein